MVKWDEKRRTVLKAISGVSASIVGLSGTGAANADPDVGDDDVAPPPGGGSGKEEYVSRQYNPPVVNIDGGQCPEVYNNGDEWAEYVLATHSGLDACRTKSSVSLEIAAHKADNDDGITLTCDPIEISSTHVEGSSLQK